MCEPVGQDGRLNSGSVCELHVVGSCCVPIVLGVLGAPHASQQRLRFRRFLFAPFPAASAEWRPLDRSIRIHRHGVKALLEISFARLLSPPDALSQKNVSASHVAALNRHSPASCPLREFNDSRRTPVPLDRFATRRIVVRPLAAQGLHHRRPSLGKSDC